MSHNEKPCLAITLGDPAGVGPEVTLKALSDPEIANLARYLLVGEAWVLQETARQIGLPAPQFTTTDVTQISAETPVVTLDLRQIDPANFRPGHLSAECGRAAVTAIRAATQLCLEGKADAMITAPVNKEAVTLAGVPFTGHTEYIADLCGARESRMLLVNDHLRVVHVTTHRSLREACQLDTASILTTITLGYQAVQRLGVAKPRIAVCGLNPHAGENGLFGEEDSAFILPAIRQAQAEGMGCDGPFAADTLFLKAVRGAYDLVVAMYHDQGHIPMKLLDFEHTVNVSLGLPIIRTSVDHGTAFDIVGKNLADPDSMKAALRLAATMARHAGRGEPRGKTEGSCS